MVVQGHSGEVKLPGCKELVTGSATLPAPRVSVTGVVSIMTSCHPVRSKARLLTLRSSTHPSEEVVRPAPGVALKGMPAQPAERRPFGLATLMSSPQGRL